MIPPSRLRVTVGENRIHRRICHSRIASNDPIMQLVADDITLLSDFHQARLHESIDMGVQATQSSCQRLGKHVNSSVWKVHRRAAVVGGSVQRTSFRDVVGYVGNVYPEPVMPVGQTLDRYSIIEVASVLAVDRHRFQQPEIGPTTQVSITKSADPVAGLPRTPRHYERPAAHTFE